MYDRRGEEEVLRGFHGCNANRLDRAGQPSLSSVDTVLNVDAREIRIASQFKGRSNVAGPIVATGRGDVLHPLRAIDLLLQEEGDLALHGLRACADVKTGDPH